MAEDLPLLCPWNERRLPREMYVKLFVVHFTVMGAYMHLLHLRRDPRGLACFLLMLVSPIAGSMLILMPLLALIVQVPICRGDPAILKQSVGILIGRLPRGNEEIVDEDCVTWPSKFPGS